MRNDGRAGASRDTRRRRRRGERRGAAKGWMANRRRRRGKFGESSGHATIRRTPFAPPGTNRCHSPLTYPNPTGERRKPRATLSPLPPLLPHPASTSRSIFIASRFWFIPFRVALSPLFPPPSTLSSSYFTLPFLPHYITVSLHVASRSRIPAI